MSDKPQSDANNTQIAPHLSAPSPLLIILLIIPLLGILAALTMTVLDMRSQRAAQLPDTLPATTGFLNYAAPDFTLDMLDGDTVSLSDYRGKTLFLNFWQTTCVPCITEMPEFLAFLADQDPEQVALLAVNFDESPETIRDFFETNDIVGIPTALDHDSRVKRLYGVAALPVTFIINPDGVVNFLQVGAMGYDEMSAYLAGVQTAYSD